MSDLVKLGVFPEIEAAVVIPLLESAGVVPVVTREAAYRSGDVLVRVREDDLPRAMQALAAEAGLGEPDEQP